MSLRYLQHRNREINREVVGVRAEAGAQLAERPELMLNRVTRRRAAKAARKLRKGGAR